MKTTTVALILLVLAPFSKAYTVLPRERLTDTPYFGPSIHLGPAHSEITYFACKFQPGTPPEEQEFVALWPGLWDPKPLQYDLVQSVTSVHGRSYMKSFCDAQVGQWCTQGYVHRTGKPDTPSRGVAIDADDTLSISYRRNVTGDGKWTQRISSAKKGRIVQFTAGSRPATVFEIGTELQGQKARYRKGTVDRQIYSNIRLVLRLAEPEFGRSLKHTTVNGKKAKVDRLQSKDGGKTWTIRQIVIPAMDPKAGAINERIAAEEMKKELENGRSAPAMIEAEGELDEVLLPRCNQDQCQKLIHPVNVAGDVV